MKDLQTFYKRQTIFSGVMIIFGFIFMNFVTSLLLKNDHMPEYLRFLLFGISFGVVAIFILGLIVNLIAWQHSLSNYNMFSPSYEIVTPCSSKKGDKKYTYVYESKYYYLVGYFEKTFNPMKLAVMLNSELSIKKVDKYTDEGIDLVSKLFEEEPIFSVYEFPEGRWDNE